jgi:hypothetical protein
VGHGETALAHDAADWNATMIVPHYINEHQSDIRGIKPGWYATDLDGDRRLKNDEGPGTPGPFLHSPLRQQS